MSLDLFMRPAQFYEMQIRQHYPHAVGKGLGQLVHSIESELDADLRESLSFVVNLRNLAAHNLDFSPSEAETQAFHQHCKKIERHFDKLASPRLATPERWEEIVAGKLSAKELIIEWEKATGNHRFVASSGHQDEISLWAADLKIAALVIPNIDSPDADQIIERSKWRYAFREQRKMKQILLIGFFAFIFELLLLGTIQDALPSALSKLFAILIWLALVGQFVWLFRNPRIFYLPAFSTALRSLVSPPSAEMRTIHDCLKGHVAALKFASAIIDDKGHECVSFTVQSQYLNSGLLGLRLRKKPLDVVLYLD